MIDMLESIYPSFNILYSIILFIIGLFFGSFLSLGNRKIRTLAAKPNVEDLEFVLDLVASGKLRPVIDRRYPLEQTAKAMQYVSDGHAQGKVVITIGSK